MNPAFSVILFTTLSGAGYGLLAWLGVMIAASGSGLFLQRDAEFSVWLTTAVFPLFIVMLVIGLALIAIGLASSTFHLGKPLRAWRAFSQWRTSWLSREGVLALATYVPTIALIALLLAAILGGDVDSGLMTFASWLGAALALLSLATVACTAMIYASLKPIPAWRHRLVVPVYLVFALLSGFLLFSALLAQARSDPLSGINDYFIAVPGMRCIPVLLAIVLAATKIAYWRAIDRVELPSRESATALAGAGKVTVFERPHTEANYLTREMGFVLARKHSRKLRIIAVALFAAIPLLALLMAALLPTTAVVALWIAAVSALAGAFVERWLFFAEAKHMVMLYY